MLVTQRARMLDPAAERFRDGQGGFHDTADDAEQLVIRPADPTDNATPSGLSSLVNALLSYAALSGEPRWHEMAERALSTVVPKARVGISHKVKKPAAGSRASRIPRCVKMSMSLPSRARYIPLP